MERNLERLIAAPHDLLIIGGGIHGLAAAYDAAQRGLSVALVERGDFGSGASFNHLKTVHGGLRYLQSGDLPRVRESIHERSALARMAPHLLTPLPYLIPTSRKLTRSRTALRAAFALDAALGHDRNRGVVPSLHLPTGRIVSRDECLRLFPGVPARPVTGAALWYDYQMRNPDRLTLAFALAADRHSACLANYVEALEPVIAGGRVVAVRSRDLMTGTTFDIPARVVLNAAGAAAGVFMRSFACREDVLLIKAMNVVTARPGSGPALGSSTRDGRLLFAVPWQGRVMVGTSHGERPCAPDDLDVSGSELESFLREINEAFPALDLHLSDITLVHRGVVPAVRRHDGTLALAGHHHIRNHARDGVGGAVSVIGAKYTTGRRVAELAVDVVMAELGRPAARGRTALEPLPGGELTSLPDAIRDARQTHGSWLDGEAVAHLVETYGSQYNLVTELARREPALATRLTPACVVLRAEVAHAVRAEMAQHLVDVVARRTPLGSAGHPGDAAARAAAAIMQQELGWDDASTAREIASLTGFYAPVRGQP